MKTLLLLRHAKSDWSHVGQLDHDRTLNARGRRDAPRIGKLLQMQELLPGLILSSTAKRARKTAHKVAAGGKFIASVEEVSDFYLAPPETYIKIIRQQSDAIECILIVGHNPGIEELSYQLTGQSELFPTATLAQIEIGVEQWDDVSLETLGTLRNIWRPRELDT